MEASLTETETTRAKNSLDEPWCFRHSEFEAPVREKLSIKRLAILALKSRIRWSLRILAPSAGRGYMVIKWDNVENRLKDEILVP